MMTLIAADRSTTADFENGFDITPLDPVTVAAGVTVSAGGNGAAGMHGAGAGHVLLRAGASVVSGLSDGISFDGAGDITLTAASSVIANRYGILFSGNGGTLQNFGSVTGESAVRANGSSHIFNEGTLTGLDHHGVLIDGSGVILSNKGLIQGHDAGLFVSATTGFVTIMNDGNIQGGTQGALQVADGSVAVRFANSGEIAGNITFSGGFDFYDGRGGTASGVIALMDGNDRAFGGSGFETFKAGLGDDVIDGGGGNDIALYAGSSADYTISSANGVQTIVDTKAADGDEGTDTLTKVRFAKFLGDNTTITLYNTKPDSVALSTGTVAETALTNTAVATFSAHDAEGDAITYTLSDPTGTFRVEGSSLILARAVDYEAGARQFSFAVTAKDAFGATTTQNFTVSVANMVEANPLTLIGTAVVDALMGEAGNDIIKGLAGIDTLKGEAGNDKIYGGLGNDLLTGGANQDIFVFDTKLGRTNAANKKVNLDKITDFSVKDDTIHLAKGVFSKIAKKGFLAKGAFFTGTKAHDADDRVIHNKNTGALLYDADGNGAKEAIQFATVAKNLKITEKDFYVL
ncbi:calcium-binding protein [Microvirga rosea]|uniref:calcium-binding protein n=1 Tax=Microvirga rosea TaxID=2715425 RepID=UPI001D09F593|nr:calcium-binding protein [Microvirga rosea]MCB8820002.1 hypothetical protein [Microvirga rosea]